MAASAQSVLSVDWYLLNILGNPKILASPTGEEGKFGEIYPKLLRGYVD
jgi:hypothetical protein